MKTHLLIVLTIVLTLCPERVFAAFTRSQNEASVGWTDNAYLIKNGKKSDLFWRVSSANSFERGGHDLGLRLNYTDYISENPNDVLGLRLSDTFKVANWKWTGALLAQNYLYGNPGTTESSFSHFGVDIFASQDRKLNQLTALEYGGGYKLRYYPSFSGRTDQYGFGRATIDREMSNRFTLGGHVESGVLLSTLSEYSRFVFELGGLSDFELRSDLAWTSELILRKSMFLNRTVDTPVSVGGGRIRRAGTRTEAETYDFVSLATEIMHRRTKALRMGGGLALNNQSSKSGDQDYSEVELLARMIYVF